MAGRETTGVGAATADLFVDRPWVVVPRRDGATGATSSASRRSRGAVGARPGPHGADDHDVAVAAISHLPLVVAAALVESRRRRSAARLAAARARSPRAAGAT